MLLDVVGLNDRGEDGKARLGIESRIVNGRVDAGHLDFLTRPRDVDQIKLQNYLLVTWQLGGEGERRSSASAARVIAYAQHAARSGRREQSEWVGEAGAVADEVQGEASPRRV